MTTAVPLAVPAGGRYGVRSGWSAGVAPSAPGAPLAQSGIAGCGRATSGRGAGAPFVVAVDVTAGAGVAARVAGADAHPCAMARTSASGGTRMVERVMRRRVSGGSAGSEALARRVLHVGVAQRSRMGDAKLLDVAQHDRRDLRRHLRSHAVQLHVADVVEHERGS